MDQLPDETPDDANERSSQWLFAWSPRRRVRAVALTIVVIVLVALVVVGLLALTTVFFPH